MSKRNRVIFSVITIVGSLLAMGYSSYQYYYALQLYREAVGGIGSAFFSTVVIWISFMQVFILVAGGYAIKESYKELRRLWK